MGLEIPLFKDFKYIPKKMTKKLSTKGWIARDSTAILGEYSTCLFRYKPYMSNAGFWEVRDGSGRWPIDLPVSLKPGECVFVKIKENEKTNPL